MANYTFTPLTTAVVGIASTSYFPASISPFTVGSSNGTVSFTGFGTDISVINSTTHSYLAGRRPKQGLVFPRGVYNK